jgi:hypothetical protein
VVRFDAVVLAWFGMVEMVGIRQVMWLVMLEYAKYRFHRSRHPKTTGVATCLVWNDLLTN